MIGDSVIGDPLVLKYISIPRLVNSVGSSIRYAEKKPTLKSTDWTTWDCTDSTLNQNEDTPFFKFSCVMLVGNTTTALISYNKYCSLFISTYNTVYLILHKHVKYVISLKLSFSSR